MGGIDKDYGDNLGSRGGSGSGEAEGYGYG